MFSKSKNNRESIIDQLIAESKKRKLERQQTREKTLELTEKLDTEWKDLIPLIGRTGKNNDDDDVPNKGRGDSYDIALRELKFEARGKVRYSAHFGLSMIHVIYSFVTVIS